jgi:hypothetical protein
MIMMVIIIIIIIIYQFGKGCQLCYFDTIEIKHVEEEEINEVRNFKIYMDQDIKQDQMGWTSIAVGIN